jgi:integrase
MTQWHKTKFKGVRYRKHTTRKHGAMLDKYFTIRFQLNGKRHEEGLGWASHGWSEQKAALEIEKLRNNFRVGEGPIRLKEKREIETKKREKKEIEKIKFGQLWSDYLQWAKNNKKHWDNDEYRYVKHLKEHLDNKYLSELTPHYLEKVKDKLTEKRLAPATVKHIMIVVRQVFNKGKIWGKWKGENPMSNGNVKLPQVENATQRALTIEEEKVLFLRLRIKSKTTWGMALVSLYAGLRFMEVANLRWQHINFRDRKITVHGKGGKARVVPMNQTVAEMLQEIKAPTTEFIDLIFPSKEEGVKQKISAAYYRTVDELGFNKNISDRRYKINFHSLRHTFATRLASAGTPLHVLRDLLGHANLDMVSRYAHQIPSQADLVVNGLDSYQE